jgi:hypothetical protein
LAQGSAGRTYLFNMSAVCPDEPCTEQGKGTNLLGGYGAIGNGGAERQRCQELCRGASVVEQFLAAGAEISFVGQIAVAHDQDAGRLGKLPASDGVF